MRRIDIDLEGERIGRAGTSNRWNMVLVGVYECDDLEDRIS